MSLLSQNDFNGIIEAAQLRGALIAVDQRSTKQDTNNIKSYGVYTGGSNVFASDIIGQGKVLSLPRHVQPGALIEYGSIDKKTSAFGLVIEPPALAPEENVYVRPLSKSQVDELLIQNPDVPKVVINEKMVTAQKVEASSVPKIVTFSNPIDKLFFGVLKGSLQKITGNSEVMDSLVWIYIGAVFIGFIGIAVIFWKNGH